VCRSVKYGDDLRPVLLRPLLGVLVAT